MKRNDDHRARGDAEAARVRAQADVPGLPNVQSPQWVECTDFVEADATQVQVFLGNETAVVLRTVPGCSPLKLAHALLRQSGITSTEWSWMVDLGELRTSDAYLLGVLIAIGNYLHRRRGRLTLYNLDKVQMPPSLREQFLKDCEQTHIQFGVSERAGQSFRGHRELAGTVHAKGRARPGTAAGAGPCT